MGEEEAAEIRESIEATPLKLRVRALEGTVYGDDQPRTYPYWSEGHERRIKALETSRSQLSGQAGEMSADVEQLAARLWAVEQMVITNLAIGCRYRRLERSLTGLERGPSSPRIEWMKWLLEHALRVHPWHFWWSNWNGRDYPPQPPERRL